MTEKSKQTEIEKQSSQASESDLESSQVEFRNQMQKYTKEVDAFASENEGSYHLYLCEDKLEYVKIHASASVSSHCFQANAINYVQCDYAFGGEYTSFHDFSMNPINTKKFYHSLSDSSDLEHIQKLIKEKFCGPQWLETLQQYCQERNIEYNYTYRSQE